MTDVERIDQVIPTLASRDAIGGHVLQLRDLLRRRGIASDVYYGRATPDRLDAGFPVDRLDDHPADRRVLLYQLSIGSPLAELFAVRPERKFVNYHNISPADLLDRWAPAVAEEVRWGRSQLADLAPVTEFAVADSRFNEGELVAAGYRSTTTLPILFDTASFRGAPDPTLAARLRRERAGGGADLLFVGKVSPHKGQDALVKALAAYREVYDPKARLRIVGGPISDTYREAVGDFAEELGLGSAVEFAGSVTHEELVAYYDHADVFLCLSRHEGFCVPLLEAMAHRLPIVARGVTAVPETVADAGLVLDADDPGLVAAAVHRVVTDDRLREVLGRAATRRLEAFSLARAEEGFASALTAASEAGAGRAVG